MMTSLRILYLTMFLETFYDWKSIPVILKSITSYAISRITFKLSLNMDEEIIPMEDLWSEIPANPSLNV